MEAGYPGCPPYPKVTDIPLSIGDTLAPGKITKGRALQLQDLLRAKRLGRAKEKDKQKAKNLLGLSLTGDFRTRAAAGRGAAESGDCCSHSLMCRDSWLQGRQGVGQECACNRGAGLPTFQVQPRAHTGHQRSDETGDHKGFQPRNGRAWLPPAALLVLLTTASCLPRKKEPWYPRSLRKGRKNVSRHIVKLGLTPR